jgi:DNA-binding transcriptional LysR family regulator
MALSSHMPDLESLEVFAAIAETGTLGGAARKLGLSQQAVSRRLALLEAKTGVALAVRTRRGSQLTAAGNFLAEWASHLLEVAHDIDTALGSLRTEGSHRLTVVASPTITEYLMPHWLLSLRSATPGPAAAVPRIDLAAASSAQVIAWVRDGIADLGFIESPSAPEGLGCRVVGADELVVVVSPTHEWARQSRIISARELADTSLVCREPHSGIRDVLAVALQRALGADSHQAPPVLELPSAGAVRAAVLAGAGPAAMSRLAVADDLHTGRLTEIPVADLDLRRDLRAIWLGGGTPPTGATRLLLDHIASRTNDAERRAVPGRRAHRPAKRGA